MITFFCHRSNSAQGRSDLANAKVAGLSEELRISPQGYSNAATILLVGYIIFQLPGTLLIKQIGPARQFAGAMMTVRKPFDLNIL